MKNNSKYCLDIKGELTKRDTKMIAKMYAWAALTAAICFGLASLILAIKF